MNEARVASLDFAAGTQGVLSLAIPEAEKTLKPGSNKVRVEITGNNSFPHTLSFLGNATKNNAPWPQSFDGSSIKSKAGTAIGTKNFSTGPLSPGQYRCEVLVNEQLIGFANFTVR